MSADDPVTPEEDRYTALFAGEEALAAGSESPTVPAALAELQPRLQRDLAGDIPEARDRAEQKLRQWQRERSLAGVRDAAGLAKLPDGEAEAWRGLWADVEKLLERAQPR